MVPDFRFFLRDGTSPTPFLLRLSDQYIGSIVGTWTLLSELRIGGQIKCGHQDVKANPVPILPQFHGIT